jgi:outer membrane protein assembly factor BamE (lipoprotein component of BamABCDE complex)
MIPPVLFGGDMAHSKDVAMAQAQGHPGSTRIGVRLRMAAAAALLALPLAGCLGNDGEVIRGFVVDERVMAQLKPGITKQTVLEQVGSPSTTSTVGGDAWYYVSQRVERKLAFMKPAVKDQRVVAVYFNKGGKLERVADYGLQDGVVFDFVSRTTPTGGREPSFVRNLLGSFGRMVGS